MINKIMSFFSKFFSKRTVNVINYRLTFNKEHDNCWYIDYPEWKGLHHNLMMVDGADLLLDYISNRAYSNPYMIEKICGDKYKSTLTLDIIVSEEEFPEDNAYIKLERIGNDSYGATYKVSHTPAFESTVWLCPVTLFVIGKYPKYFYIKKNYLS